MDVLEGLNDEQRAAARHDDGPLLVVAGAGTGKTRVITHRIARLITDGKAKPEEVLALTFTEKAAREMADRLYDLIGWQSFSVPVLTFNAFGAELLGRYATHIGRSTRGGLINDTQKALLLQQRINDISLQYYGLQADMFGFMQTIVRYIGRLQNAGITPANYRTFADGLGTDSGGRHPADVLEQQDLAVLYELYDRIKAETGTYDYYDQLALPLGILQTRPNLAERLRGQYRYVLVDEYQDTSPVQDALLRELVPPGGNIFAVGDDDQAIYSFRGADISGILRFSEHFGVKHPLVLTHNYRSGQPILDAAYRLIRHNDPDRLEVRLGIDKALVARDDTATVEFVPHASPADEQAAVINAVEAELTAGTAAADISILARSNAVLRSYAKALRGRAIGFAVSTEVNIFEQRELINLWHLLQWINHTASDEAITHVVLGPFVGWPVARWRAVIEQASTSLESVEAALRQLAVRDKTARELVEQLDLWRTWAAEETVSRLAYRLVFEGGVADALIAKGQTQPRVLRVFEDLHRLLGHMQDFETIWPDQSLAAYASQFPEPPRLETNETLGDSEGVQLLTVHASKGLEFQSVYVVNCTAKAWSPSASMGLEVPVELTEEIELPPEHEERRLMYVAATRAKRQLTLSAPTQTAGGQRQTVSPLVGELITGSLAKSTEANTATIEKSLQKLQQFYPLEHELPARLPFETADGWIELGVGALGSYDEAPHDFYLEHVLGISRPFGPQLAFGSAIHGAIQTYYEAKLRGETAGADELKTRLDELWSDRGYESREQAELAHQRAHDTIERFVAREKASGSVAEATELPVRFELAEAKLRLRGRIDATFRTAEGLEIRDFKTGRLFDEEKLADKAKTSFQLRTYALAMEQLAGELPAKVTLDYVVTGAVGSAELSSRVLANHRAKLIKLAERLRARDFDPGAPSDFNRAAAFKYYGTEADEPEPD